MYPIQFSCIKFVFYCCMLNLFEWFLAVSRWSFRQLESNAAQDHSFKIEWIAFLFQYWGNYQINLILCNQFGQEAGRCLRFDILILLPNYVISKLGNTLFIWKTVVKNCIWKHIQKFFSTNFKAFNSSLGYIVYIKQNITSNWHITSIRHASMKLWLFFFIYFFA